MFNFELNDRLGIGAGDRTNVERVGDASAGWGHAYGSLDVKAVQALGFRDVVELGELSTKGWQQIEQLPQNVLIYLKIWGGSALIHQNMHGIGAQIVRELEYSSMWNG